MTKQIITLVTILLLVMSFTMNVNAEQKVTELKFTTTVPPVADLGRAQKAWIEKCEKDAGGKLKIIPYWANSMFKPREIFRGVLDGQADLCFFSPNIELGLLKLNGISWLPMIDWPTEHAVGAIYRQLLEKFPQLKAEYRGLMLYGVVGGTPSQIGTSGKEVRVPSDLKGMKITPSTPEIARMVISSGGAPVNLVVSDWYTSLDKGVTDGFINSYGALLAFKCIDLLEYYALIEPGGLNNTPKMLLINPDNWKKIPPDIQKVLKDNESFYIESVTNAMIGEAKKALGIAKKKGKTIVKLTPDEVKLWKQHASSAHNDWIAKYEDKGSKEIYAELNRLIREYKGK